MKTAKAIIIVSGLCSALLFIAHLTTLPGYSISGWILSKRVTKNVHYSVSGTPNANSGLTSRWGNNRPPENRAHNILSEIEVRIKHQNREAGIISLNVTGESEEDVDAFIELVNRDFDRSYTSRTTLNSVSLPERQAHSIDISPPEKSYYWRQKYLGILVFNFSISIVALIAMSKK